MIEVIQQKRIGQLVVSFGRFGDQWYVARQFRFNKPRVRLFHHRQHAVEYGKELAKRKPRTRIVRRVEHVGTIYKVGSMYLVSMRRWERATGKRRAVGFFDVNNAMVRFEEERLDVFKQTAA